MKRVATLVAVLLFGACCYLMGARTARRVSPVTKFAMSTESPADVTGASSSRAPSSDCQNVKNQLAICMAYHPLESEQDKQLAMCHGDLAACREARPTLPSCYDFADAAETYDRQLGEVDPSPETIERAKNLSAEDCGAILEWAARAGGKQATCLQGAAPMGWKERYGRPIGARPFVKACNAPTMKRDDVMNAWFRYQEDRVRETGHDVAHRFHMSPDGGVRMLSPPFLDDGGD
jgi:hypothetical protein